MSFAVQVSRRRSDLRQRDLVGVCVVLNVEDEGVFVGVMLNDVVVHVHQDPNTGNTFNFIIKFEIGQNSLCVFPLTLFYFSCTLWLSFPRARCTSLISTKDKETWRCFIDRCSPAKQTAPHLTSMCKTCRNSTHSLHQASERGRLQHQSVKHLVALLSYVQQHYREKNEYIAHI